MNKLAKSWIFTTSHSLTMGVTFLTDVFLGLILVSSFGLFAIFFTKSTHSYPLITDYCYS